MCEARSRADGVTMRLRIPERIDADDRRVLENLRSCPSRQRRQAVDIFAAVDLKCLGIIDAMEIMLGLELVAHMFDLPAFHFGSEILAQHLQAARSIGRRHRHWRLPARLHSAQYLASALRWRWPGHIRRLPSTATRVRGHPRNRSRAIRSPSGRLYPGITVPSWWPDAFQPICRPSRTATLAPIRAASSATASPAKPAPITQISTSRSNDSRDRARIVGGSRPLVALVEVSLISFSYGPIGRLSPCSRLIYEGAHDLFTKLHTLWRIMRQPRSVH